MKSITADDPIESWRRGLGGVLDYVSENHARAVWALLLLCVLAFLPGLGKIPAVDRDEARFAQVSKQMYIAEDPLAIEFQNETTDKQPPGIHWLQVISLKVSELVGRRDTLTRIVNYRFPSFFGAIGAVLLLYWAALPFLRARAAIVACIALASCVLLGMQARMATPESVFLFTMVAALGALARAYLAEDEDAPPLALAPIFWIALAAGVLLKGTTVILIVGLPVLTLCILDRSAAWLMRLRPLIGIPLFLLLVLPWLIAVSARAGLLFLVQSALQDMLAKAFTSQQGHGAPPGYYVVMFFLTFWPASILAGLAAPAAWRERGEAPTRFLLAWIVPTWILLECVITKRPHFMLPLYPAAAILLARFIDTQRLSRVRWMEYGTFWWFAIPVGLAVAALILLLRFEGDLGWRAWPFFAAAVVFGFRAWWLYEVDGPERSLLRASATSILLAIAIFWSALPATTSLFPSTAVARAVHASECKDAAVAAAGYREPSLVLLMGAETIVTDGAGAADFLTRGPCRFAVIESHYDRQFARRAEAIGLRYDKVQNFSGVAIGPRSRINFAIYRSRGAQ